MMSALGDPTRQAIFDRLSDGALPVGKLAAGMPISRPAVSQHLKVLRQVGLVRDQQIGTRRLYQVDPQGLAVLRTYLDQFWERSLAAFQSAAESGAKPEESSRHDSGDHPRPA